MELGLRPRDRILVLGSSGWFGKEFLALLPADVPVLDVPGPSSGIHVEDHEIADFAPTVIANFAFLTRERVDIEGVEAFQRINAQLTERFLRCAQLPSVRGVLTISSGAAITEPDHPYGQLKLAEERDALALSSSTRTVVVARTYSVSGPFVRRPRNYAFSDLIMQAMLGEMEVKASVPVFRRYCSVADTLAVSTRSLDAGRSGVFETGGPLVEMGELAEAVRAVVAPQARIHREWNSEADSRHYASDDISWQDWTTAVSLRPADLTEQITATARGLRDVRT